MFKKFVLIIGICLFFVGCDNGKIINNDSVSLTLKNPYTSGDFYLNYYKYDNNKNLIPFGHIFLRNSEASTVEVNGQFENDILTLSIKSGQANGKTELPLPGCKKYIFTQNKSFPNSTKLSDKEELYLFSFMDSSNWEDTEILFFAEIKPD